MKPELAISKIYSDTDIVEIAVSVWNGVFGGAVELYIGHDDLARCANELQGFPASTTDARQLDLGTFDPTLAGGGASLYFFCTDMAGHVQVEVGLENGHPLARIRQRVELFAALHPASIDRFVAELGAVGKDAASAAILEFAEPVYRA